MFDPQTELSTLVPIYTLDPSIVIVLPSPNPHQHAHAHPSNNQLTGLKPAAKVSHEVLLLDEADVFLEERSLSDMQRNSLVSGKHLFATYKL